MVCLDFLRWDAFRVMNADTIGEKLFETVFILPSVPDEVNQDLMSIVWPGDWVGKNLFTRELRKEEGVSHQCLG